MRSALRIAAACAFVAGLLPYAFAGNANLPIGGLRNANREIGVPGQTEAIPDTAKILVDRLDLERYKATIKGLTQFGDRKQGTDRNRRAIDWIEAQLKSYGCANIERLQYNYQPPSPDTRTTQPNTAGGPGT